MNWFARLRAAARKAGRVAAESDPPCAPQGDGEPDLTRREREVFALLLQGRKQREIAEQLSVRPTTVSFHVQSLYRKLGIHDRAQLFIRYGAPGNRYRMASEEEEA